MKINFNFNSYADKKSHYFSKDYLLKNLNQFKETINNPANGFFHLTDDFSPIESCQSVLNKFKQKKVFIQVGIGGSALGPELLVESLGNPQKRFLCLDNIDSDYLFDQLESLESHKECLFYIVSKSGGTAETLAQLSILFQWLIERGVNESEFSQYFIIATDPVSGDLRKIANDFNIESLDIPPNVGGRYSILTTVGLMPALFLDINAHELFNGANEMKQQLLSENFNENPLLQTFAHLFSLYKESNINQTVLMPYSSKLKKLSSWFVQLWAESLGKINRSIGYSFV